MLYSIPASPDICTVDHDNCIKSMCPFAFVYMCIHCIHVCLCVGGRVYSWGSNVHGQLGHNAAVINISTPEVHVPYA